MRRRTWVPAVVVSAVISTAVWQAPAAYAVDGGTLVIANTVWRVAVGGKPDLMSTINVSEVNSFPNQGQTYYLPSSQIGGTVPLYRLFNPNWGGPPGDHMNSTTAGEAGFTTESVLGFPFTSQPTGTSQYLRTFNGCTGDHGDRSVYESPQSCYGDEPKGVYGYPRFGNSSFSALSLNGGGVTIESNRVAGGALFHWTHNGVQYINNRDYGRNMQSSVFFNRGGVQSNPTESGDMWTDFDMPVWARHGSPLASASNNTSTLTQSTRSVPIDFIPQNFNGGQFRPAIYKDFQLGKDITLNWGGQGPVARYQTVLSSPSLSTGYIEIPTAYLKASFNRYFTYDANSNVLTEVFPPLNCPDTGQYYHYTPPNRGGVIISNADMTQAMGVYGANVSVGGSVSEFLLGKFIGGQCGGGTGEFDFAASKWSVIRNGPFGSGTKVFTTYPMSGSVSQIRAIMTQLRIWGNA
jgi:hypothetical protein